ncbi:MAG TPA: hypothetical protein VIM85_07775 [Pseudomonadales bacterium]
MDLTEHIANWLGSSVLTSDQGIQCTSGLGAVFGSTRGEIRQDNQDRVIGASFQSSYSADRDFLLYALCDGMGGGRDGGRCAELTLATVINHLVYHKEVESGLRLRNGVIRANEAIFEHYRAAGGTTFTGMIFGRTGRVIAINAGDSRYYRFSSGKRDFIQVSEDDTLAGELAKLRGKSVSDLKAEHLSNYLAQFVGVGEDIVPRVYDESEYVRDHGFLLTSDGAHSMGIDTLSRLILNAGNSSMAIRRLLTVSHWLGGHDNASAIYIPSNVRITSNQNRDSRFAVLRLFTAGASKDLYLPKEIFDVPERKNSQSMLSYEKNKRPEEKNRSDGGFNPKSQENGGKSISQKNKKQSSKKAQLKAKKNQAEKNAQLDIAIEPAVDRDGEGGNGST